MGAHSDKCQSIACFAHQHSFDRSIWKSLLSQPSKNFDVGSLPLDRQNVLVLKDNFVYRSSSLFPKSLDLENSGIWEKYYVLKVT